MKLIFYIEPRWFGSGQCVYWRRAMVIIKVLINLLGVLALEPLEIAEPLLDVQERAVVCVRSVDADGDNVGSRRWACA